MAFEKKGPPPKGVPTRDKWLIIGEPKSGKSTLVSSLPNVGVWDTEQGHSKLSGHHVSDIIETARRERVRPLDVIRADLGLIKEECPFDWLAFDTLDAAQEWCEESTLDYYNDWHNRDDSNRYRALGEIPQHAGWADFRKRFMSLTKALSLLPCNTVFVAHNKRMIDESTGNACKQLDLVGKLQHWFPGYVDHVGVVSKAKGDNGVLYQISFEGWEVLTKKGYTVTVAGSRDDCLNGQVFPMPKDDPFKGIREAYEN